MAEPLTSGDLPQRPLSTTGMRQPNPIVAIIGATGTGKSQLAVDLAARFNGEIINADAMQLYAGLPVITNRITVDEMKGIPHHLLGSIDLTEEPWQVGVFRKKALGLIHSIRAKGKLPIVVGGTHYYTQALLFEDALVDEEDVTSSGDNLASAEVEKKWPILGSSTEDMLQELRKLDPVMADRWHPNDRRKIRRSLEIWLRTGRKASDVYTDQTKRRKLDSTHVEVNETQSELITGAVQPVVVESPGTGPDTPMRFDPLVFWVHASPGFLKSRLDQRVDAMVQHGLISEVMSLRKFLVEQELNGNPPDTTRGIWISIGYKEFKDYMLAFEGGATQQELDSLKQLAIERTKIATRQYAKRQLRWIRIKLLNAMIECNQDDHLFLLDGTNVGAWQQMVARPAAELLQTFLEAGELPQPRTLSELAYETLVPQRAYDVSKRRDLWQRQTCEVCGVTTVTLDDWTKHISSKGHKFAVKKRDQQRVDSNLPASTIPVAKPGNEYG